MFQIVPNFLSRVCKQDAANDIFRNKIVKPGNDKIVTTSPCSICRIDCGWHREGSIDEGHLVLHRKSYHHCAALCGVVLVVKRLGGKDESWAIRMM